MLGRRIVALPHNAPKSGYQFGSGTAKFLMMMKRKLGEHLLSFGSKHEEHFAAVVVRPRAVHKSSRFQAVHQLYGAVVADLHAIGQLADSRTHAGGHALNRQHQLVLAPLQSCLLYRLFAEVEKPADLVPELCQRLVIRQGEPFHAADCIVPRSTSFNRIS